jgi:hypothetical protein
MHSARASHSATLLPNGTVLVAGGYGPSPLSSAELYGIGLGFDSSWQPQIDPFTSPLSPGASLAITGSRFRGISGASGGGTQDSPADFPVVQLRSVESERAVFLMSTNWSANMLATEPVNAFPPGNALVTVFVNGIPSTGSVLTVRVPVPTTITLTEARAVTNGLFQFSFTNSPGALFGVLATTNLALPLTNWAALGGVTEVSPGRFQFSDAPVANAAPRFYVVRSP